MTNLCRTGENRKPRILDAVGLMIILISGLFVVIRTTGYGPWVGDITVWIFVHDWLIRGVPLYEGVFDHKDWGFFAVTNPFYRLAGITGLYLSGLAAVVAFVVGIFLTVRQIVSWRRASLIAAVAGATYTAAPSYLSTYTENYAIAFAVLALGLLFRYPVASGAIFALSASVKVSGISLLALVLIVDSALQFFSQKSGLTFVIRRVFRVFAGFGIAAMAIVGWAYAQGSLTGWVDIIDYNIEYGAVRRETMPSPFNVAAFFKFAYPGSVMVFFSAWALSVGALLALFRISSSHQGFLRWTSTARVRPLVLSIALTFGSVVVLISQFPPRYQHYQYFFGAALSLSAVLVAILWQYFSVNSRTFCVLFLTAVILPVLTGSALLIRTEGSGAFATGLTRWGQLDEGGVPITALEKIQPNSSLAFVNIDGLIKSQSIPEDAQLQCRFFYVPSHSLPRYRTEMFNCLQAGADYVILQGDLSSASQFNTDVLRVLNAEYEKCKVADTVFQLWSRTASECPTE